MINFSIYFCFENVHIGFGNIALENRLSLYFEADFDSVEMHFTLKGKSSAQSENFRNKVSFESYQHNIIYAHGCPDKWNLTGKTCKFWKSIWLLIFLRDFFPKILNFSMFSEMLLINNILLSLVLITAGSAWRCIRFSAIL